MPGQKYTPTTNISHSEENKEFYDKLFVAAKEGDIDTLMVLEQEMHQRYENFIGYHPGANMLPFLLCCVRDDGDKMPWDYVASNQHQHVFDACYQQSFDPAAKEKAFECEVKNFLWAFVCNQIESASEFLEAHPIYLHNEITSVYPVPEGPLLRVAVYNNSLPLLAFLLEKGVKDYLKESESSLSEACRLGHIEVASLLKRRGMILTNNIIVKALNRGDIVFFKTILAIKAYKNEEDLYRFFANTLDNRSDDPKIINDPALLEIAIILLEEMNDFHIPFLCAAIRGRLELMQFMLRKSDLNLNFYIEQYPSDSPFRHFSKKTALGLAAQAGQPEVVDYLLALGAKINVPNALNPIKLAEKYLPCYPRRYSSIIAQLKEADSFFTKLTSNVSELSFLNKRQQRPSEAGFVTYQSPRPGDSNQN